MKKVIALNELNAERMELTEELLDSLKKIYPSLRRLRVGENLEGIILSDNGKFVGILQCDLDNKCITALEVNPAYQGRGVGSYLIDEARNLGASRVCLKKSNERAINLFKKKGYIAYKKTDNLLFLSNRRLALKKTKINHILTESTGIARKRRLVEETVLKTMKLLDPSGHNEKVYEDFFKTMTDKAFDKWIKEFLADESENFYVEVTPFAKGEMKMKDIEKAAKYLKIPLTEHIYLPFTNPDGKPVKTQHPVPVGYIHLRRQQQLLSKKNAFSTNIDQRNAKTGQVTGSDKSGRISDTENYSLVAIGANEALKEFLGARADDSVMKQTMIKDISRDGFTTLKNMRSNVGNKQALNTLDVYFLGAGIKTDLITPGLMLKRNMDEKEVRSRIQEKYN